MSHNKYQDVNPLEKLHPGEPFFFIRAQDIHSPAIIGVYASMLNTNGDKLGSLQVDALRESVTTWQRANQHLVKHPD